ncbi:class I SAM-dependent methyltransferase [Candidatus Pacearchaeota archaeon]|nr:class I SAM-dependent methyltransferase [Candidatus Pacearchaeota archaeon]
MINMETSKLSKIWNKHANQEKSKNYDFSLKNIKKSDDFNTQWLLKLSRQKKGKKLLDAGCGIGYFVTMARNLGLKAEGIDISPEAVKIAKKRGEKVILGDLRKMSFKSRSFDIVLAEGSIEHFPETEKAMSEISRILKKNGIFIGNVPNKFTIFTITKIIQQIFGIWKCGYEKSFTKSRIKNLLEKDFRTIEMKKSKIAIGTQHPILTRIIREIDSFLMLFGLGGAHHYFYCIKK